MMMMPVLEGEEEAEWDWWTMLGITRPKGGVWVEEWKRLETAVQDEWKRTIRQLAETEEEKERQTHGGSGPAAAAAAAAAAADDTSAPWAAAMSEGG
ncbi:Hypothetical protein NocV09_07400100, partial [Nannochloropsis oceanica]